MGGIGYEEYDLRSPAFGALEILSICLCYFLFALLMDWKNVPKDYFAWMLFCGGVLISTEVLWIFADGRGVLNGRAEQGRYFHRLGYFQQHRRGHCHDDARLRVSGGLKEARLAVPFGRNCHVRCSCAHPFAHGDRRRTVRPFIQRRSSDRESEGSQKDRPFRCYGGPVRGRGSPLRRSILSKCFPSSATFFTLKKPVQEG